MAFAQEPVAPRDTAPDTWVATDGLGRSLPGFEECGPPREGKIAAIFYFTWLGQHSKQVYDISKILAADPDNPPWGPPGAFHFWGEPHMGYYLSDDEFVIRKHAQMLADAGIDVIVCDVTNAFTYDEVYLTVCRVFEDVRRHGGRTPQIAFLANAHCGPVVQRLYDNFYGKGLHSDLWFRWQGKPLVLAIPEDISPEMREFFTVRRSWAWTHPQGWFGDGRDKWPWLDHYPQNPGWHESPDKPEQLAVAVAQHPTTNIGRSFHAGKQPPQDQLDTDAGLCFAEQWRRALEVDPQVVFITGWNEWVAQRFIQGEGTGHCAGKTLKPGDTYFVDQYSREYSRDCEPMRGGHGDAYYYQMIDGIRRFKGVRPAPQASAPKTIAIGADFGQWAEVGPEYRDDLGDTAHRDEPAWEPLPNYVNTTGRNDLDTMKVARDAQSLFFYAQVAADLTPPEGDCWMVLLLDADGDPRNGWHGYDFRLNRTRTEGGACSVERFGDAGWEAVGEGRIAFAGRELHLSVSRELLGLAADPLRVDFKWLDNVPDSGDILDFIDKGDVAPNGRFKYRYEG